MVARVASFEGVDIEAAKSTMGEAEAIIRPIVEPLRGYQGQLELLAPDGKVLAITLFDSEANADAAEPTFEQEMPRKLGELYRSWGGRRVAVDRYEVIADSRR
jgi:hypothetical protein